MQGGWTEGVMEGCVEGVYRGAAVVGGQGRTFKHFVAPAHAFQKSFI